MVSQIRNKCASLSIVLSILIGTSLGDSYHHGNARRSLRSSVNDQSGIRNDDDDDGGGTGRIRSILDYGGELMSRVLFLDKLTRVLTNIHLVICYLPHSYS